MSAKKRANHSEDLYEILLACPCHPDAKKVMVANMWLPTKKLIIDNRYQHALNENRSARYAANWNDALAGLITVSERKKDHVYSVLDGQHRSRAAQIVGLDDVWCEVFFDLTIEEEAYIFWQRNKERVPINSLEQFRSALTAGDETTKSVQAILDDVGVFVGDAINDPNAYRAVAGLMTLYRWGVLKETLTYTRAAWPKEPRVKDKILLLGVGQVIWNFRGELKIKRLVESMGKQSLKKLLLDAATLKATLGQTDSQHMARLILKIYNAEDRAGKLDETKMKMPSRGPAVTAKSGTRE